MLQKHTILPSVESWSSILPIFQVTRQVAKCKCPKRFQVEQIGANKYRVKTFWFKLLIRFMKSFNVV